MASKSDETSLGLPLNARCVVTRSIEMRQKSTPAVAAIFQCEIDEALPYLVVLVADGNLMFQGRIDPTAAKVRAEHLPDKDGPTEELSNATILHVLSSFLLEDANPRVSVSYDYQVDVDDQIMGIKVVLRETLATGLVKVLWSDTLNASNDNASSMLKFCSVLGSCVNDTKHRVESLRKELDVTNTNLESWKDTAGKLDRDWQSEKDDLTHRFFELYRKTHEQLVKSRKEVKQLEAKLQEARKEKPAATTKKTPAAAALPVDFGQPDDQDYNTYNDTFVEQLAAGKRTHGTVMYRTNALTGAKEVTGEQVDELLKNPRAFGLSSSQGVDAIPSNHKRSGNSVESLRTVDKRVKHVSL